MTKANIDDRRMARAGVKTDISGTRQLGGRTGSDGHRPTRPERLEHQGHHTVPVASTLATLTFDDRGVGPRQRHGRPRGRTTPTLCRRRQRLDRHDVVYVGMSASGIKGRNQRHKRSKMTRWTHFPVFEVWDNISPDEIKELEGLFRHMNYRRLDEPLSFARP
jgi:hypothetical protein